MADQPTLIVTGASGHLGSRVVELLLEGGHTALVATTRTPDQLAQFAARGVTVRFADYDQPDSLAKAFEGADRLLLISTDALGIPGQRLNQHRTAVKAAEQAGVRHVVYTSMPNPVPDNPIIIASDHHRSEQALDASGMGYTILRNNFYTEILLNSYEQALKLGSHIHANGQGKVGYVTREDCARAGAAALAADFNGRRVLDITGPDAVSDVDLAHLFSTMAGRSIPNVEITPNAMLTNMTGAGVPQPVAAMYTSFAAGTAKGVADIVSGAFTELTGQPPTTVRDFLAATVPAQSNT